MRRSIAISASYDFRQRIFYTLIALLVATVCMYAYFLNIAIKDAVFVSDNDRIMADMRSELSAIENSYLAQEDAVSLQHAHELGFIDDTKPIYITSTIEASRLSFNSISQ